MHIADGVLSWPVIVTSIAVSALCVQRGLRDLTPETLPMAAILAAAFFVLSTIHLPVGPASVHLMFNGLAGLLLGWAVFPVLFVGLLVQAALLGFGGFSVLGANLLIMGLPGILAYLLLRPLVKRHPKVAGLSAGFLGVVVAGVMASLLLASTGRWLVDVAAVLVIAHLPVALADAVLASAIVSMMVRLRPEAFKPLVIDPAWHEEGATR